MGINVAAQCSACRIQLWRIFWLSYHLSSARKCFNTNYNFRWHLIISFFFIWFSPRKLLYVFVLPEETFKRASRKHNWFLLWFFSSLVPDRKYVLFKWQPYFVHIFVYYYMLWCYRHIWVWATNFSLANSHWKAGKVGCRWQKNRLSCCELGVPELTFGSHTSLSLLCHRSYIKCNSGERTRMNSSSEFIKRRLLKFLVKLKVKFR